MDYKQKVNKIFNELDEIVKLPFGEIPSGVKVNLFEALSKLATACNEWDKYERGYVESSEDRNKDNLDKIFNGLSPYEEGKSAFSFFKVFGTKPRNPYEPSIYRQGEPSKESEWDRGFYDAEEKYFHPERIKQTSDKPIKSSSKENLVKSLRSLDKDRLPPAMTYSYLSKYAKEQGYTYNDTKDWTAGEWLIFLNTYRPKSVKSSKLIKSSTYQFVAEFDGQYQPRIIDYMFKNGTPSWTDANEDYSNGKVFTEQELPKVAKQLERYYAETSEGASDIEIVRDNGDSVYLEEFLQEGSFDKAWEKAVAEDEAWEKEHFWDKED